MTNIYKRSIGIVFEVSTEQDLTNATNTALLVKKPSNKSATWSATIHGAPSGGILTYTTIDGDLDEHGFYYLQSYAEFPTGRQLYGTAVRFKVLDSFEAP